jgi:ABC-type uncharacterized transport system permease subunit
MVSLTFVITAILYAASCAIFLALMARGTENLSRMAVRTLAAAAISHVIYFWTDFFVTGHVPFGDIFQTLSVATLVIVSAYLLVHRRYRVTVLGGFITPVTLLFFLGAGLGTRVSSVPPEVKSILTPIHIGVNLLGIAAFALAFAASLAYVVQERLLRRKKIGGLFQRLPPLDVLDSLGFRLLTIGFPLLTIGIVTGTIWAVQLDGTPVVTPAQGFALAAWVVFAAVLLLRVAVGWRGRRAAIGTMLGFVCAAAVLVGYMFQAGTEG